MARGALAEELSPPFAALVKTYAALTTIVMLDKAPARNAAELRRQSRLVARNTALMICGPAIITNASGRTDRRVLTEDHPDGAMPARRGGRTVGR